ncbi:hypothetical protein ACF0H5_009964 [Mactra antiquata]
MKLRKPIPECYAREWGLMKGYRQFFNWHTTRGRIRMIVCFEIPIVAAAYMLFKANKQRKINNVVKAKKAEDANALTEATNRWLANGRTFVGYD